MQTHIGVSGYTSYTNDGTNIPPIVSPSSASQQSAAHELLQIKHAELKTAAEGLQQEKQRLLSEHKQLTENVASLQAQLDSNAERVNAIVAHEAECDRLIKDAIKRADDMESNRNYLKKKVQTLTAQIDKMMKREEEREKHDTHNNRSSFNHRANSPMPAPSPTGSSPATAQSQLSEREQLTSALAALNDELIEVRRENNELSSAVERYKSAFEETLLQRQIHQQQQSQRHLYSLYHHIVGIVVSGYSCPLVYQRTYILN